MKRAKRHQRQRLEVASYAGGYYVSRPVAMMRIINDGCKLVGKPLWDMERIGFLITGIELEKYSGARNENQETHARQGRQG
jgi:hypothetical protein